VRTRASPLLAQSVVSSTVHSSRPFAICTMVTVDLAVMQSSTLVLLIVAASAFLFLIAICVCHNRQIASLKSRLGEERVARRSCEHRNELVFLAIPFPMWVYDRKTLQFLEVNEAAVNAYGYSREEFLAMTLTEIRPPEDVPQFLELVLRRHVGQTRSGRVRHRRKDGSVLMVEVMAFQYDALDFRREMVLALDVTEQHHTEQSLRNSEATLKFLIDNAPFGIAQSTTADDRLWSANPALLQMLGGYSLEEAQQLSLSQQLYADAGERERLLDVLQRNRQVQGWETSMRRRDGSLVPVRISSSISSDHGVPEFFSSYIEDMTQQAKLEQQVRQVQKLEAVGRLAGGMAHDFNNILVVIKLSTEMMLGQITPDSSFSRPLLQVSNAADRAAALTRQMLAFGRQQILQPRIINMNAVVGETAQMLRRIIGEDIELVTNLSENVENSKLDPDQLTQVILNLAVNARDAMPQGGELRVETSTVDLDEAYALEHPPVQQGRYVMLAVTDTGTGIDEAVLPRIFDPFFTTKELGKGTGLGLSIVYGIVKQSGGYIWVFSKPGQGTTFKIYFPATTATAELPTLRAGDDAPVCGQLVLLVDDDASIRANVGECLQQLGYRVLEAEDGDAALKLCEQTNGEISLVLTDAVMAGKSGGQLASELGERYPEIRVLFMSGYVQDSASRRDILLRGPFLQKPFSVADLAKAVREAIVSLPTEHLTGYRRLLTAEQKQLV